MSASDAIFDTYFALLERPELRQLGAVKYQIRHQTPFFVKDVYEHSSGQRFSSEAAAYQHWTEVGRRQGLHWADGKDTLLKIVLKAKDEPFLIDAWIAHHAAIVGYENLIIMDCGSQDPAYLEKLRFYEAKVLIFDYRRYYDHLHATRSNADFFGFVGQNCKYVAILDADEFLFARQGAMFSSSLVKSVLREQNLQLFCGVWVNAVGSCRSGGGEQDIFSTSLLDMRSEWLRAGAIDGKAIARNDILLQMGHLGHNLHAPDVFPFVSEQSFGSIFVLHLRNFSPEYMRRRILQHLIAKGVVSAGRRGSFEEQIVALIEAPETPAFIKGYASAYMNCDQDLFEPAMADVVAADLINSREVQCLPKLEAAITSLDLSEIIQERRDVVFPGDAA